ncbi:hypothetical protein PAQ31011_04387 [Pandoraea aquatica]|uniref:Uncharacterized protein n=1 Tax=Pandoraea aquatica TaxID=2508290 RepID=A0A5E4Y8U2_9BURK|nr:hypothetical protein [Pandoraea aquatica]VVE45221.1 hypothetical protein PAQ31011_04387 [Pandoraea aquatica]
MHTIMQAASPAVASTSLAPPPETPDSQPSGTARLPRMSSRQRESSAFVKSEAGNTLSPPPRPWPALVANTSPRKISDFGLATKTRHHGSLPNLANESGMVRPASTIAATLSSMRVTPASPATPAAPAMPPSAVLPDLSNRNVKYNAPMGFFVHRNQYIRVNPAGTRFSVPSPEDVQNAGLPAVPVFRDSVKGQISSDLVEPGRVGNAQGIAPASTGATATLVPLVLSDIVEGLPFEKAVFGTCIPGAASTVVVQVEANRFHAARMPKPQAQADAAEMEFRWLDPDVPQDKHLIDAFRTIKQQVKTDTLALHRSPSYRNIQRQLAAQVPDSRKEHPTPSVDEATYQIFTSEQAQRNFVANNKASMSRRELFSPETHEFDLAVYQTLLGPELVFETAGEWNIGNAAGVVDLKSRLRENNLAFAAVETAAGAKVYFSLSGGARAEGFELPIQREMSALGDIDEIKIGRFMFIDAKRRLAKYVQEAPDSPGKTATQISLPVLGHDPAPVIDRTQDAEQILATLIAREARDHPITGGVHFNTLLDTCDSCASALALLQIQTGQPVSVIYLRDYGATTANSRDPVIRAMQEFAASTNELYAHLLTGDYREMAKVARRLPVPRMLESLTHVLMNVTGDFTDADHLGVICNGYYLRVLAALVRTEVVSSPAVVEALLSPEGRDYVSLLGRRVAMHPMLARGWASLMHELRDADVERPTLLKILLSKPEGAARCFYVELLRAPHSPRDARNPLVAWMDSAGLVPKMNELPQYVSLRRSITLAVRLQVQVDRAPNLAYEPVPLKEVLRHAREDLSLSSLNSADNERLASKMRDAMPMITIGEQWEYRAMIEDIVTGEWKKVAPDTTAPGYIAAGIIENRGAEYGRSLIETRRPLIDDIVERHTADYAEFQQRNPGASQSAIQEQFEACLRAARTEYRAMISGDSDPAQEHLASTATEAATNTKDAAAKQKVKKEAEKEAEKAAKSAQLSAQTAIESETQRSARLAIAEATRREARQQALQAGRTASLQAYTRASQSAKAEALKRATQESAARAKREVAARAHQTIVRREAAAASNAWWDREVADMQRRLNLVKTGSAQAEPEIESRLDAIKKVTTKQLETRFEKLRAPTKSS